MKFTKHALERMKQRGISVEDIRKAVEEPDKVVEDSELRFMKLIEDKLLVVVAKRLDDDLLIITAFKTSKTSKYLGNEQTSTF